MVLGYDFWGQPIERCHLYLPPFDSHCHGNEIWDKIGYNSACVRYICKIFCAYRGVFRDGPSNAANQIFPRATLIAMATKIVHNAYVRYILKIFASDGEGFSRLGYFGMGSAQLFKSTHMHPCKNHTLNIRKTVII